MIFKKEDENYIYGIISKNVKKYRKLKGWTQEQLAQEINYSLSFISGLESSYHQSFSLGAIWRISRALDVELPKLFEDSERNANNFKVNRRYVLYKCPKCGTRNKMPIQIVKHFAEIYKLAGNEEPPHFNCPNCNGQMFPTHSIDFNNL